MAILKIKRQKLNSEEVYWQSFMVDPPPRATVAWALYEINSHVPLLDVEGNDASPIVWSCGCGQQTCGACAMVINGKPTLACAAFLNELTKSSEVITIQPLTKFPVVCDLATDRTLLQEGLLRVKAWLSGKAKKESRTPENLLKISKCIMCGCCYEVCPNCLPGSDFVGPSSLHGAYRAMLQETDAGNAALIRTEAKKLGSGLCSKSLACEKVCPAGIKIAGTLVGL